MHSITIILMVIAIIVGLVYAVKFLKMLFKGEVFLLMRFWPVIVIILIVAVVFIVAGDIFGLIFN